MANWDKILSRGTVEDRRSFGPTARVGGLGIGGIALYLLFSYLSTGTVNVDDVLTQLQTTQVQQQPIDTAAFAGTDRYEVFTSTVLGSTTDMWNNLFAQSNQTYTPPTLVLFRGSTTSTCGGATSDVGPHYCTGDNTIYLDETFFDVLQKQFGGSGGDVAQAYVIAHEVGHHVQHELSIQNTSSIQAELQADCFAGLWAGSIKNQGVFEPDEIKEALDAAAAVGDDTIQKTTTGRVTPETWTHGSSAERVAAFTKGYDSGSFSACSS